MAAHHRKKNVLVKVIVELVHAPVEPLPGILNIDGPLIVSEFAHRIPPPDWQPTAGQGTE